MEQYEFERGISKRDILFCLLAIAINLIAVNIAMIFLMLHLGGLF